MRLFLLTALTMTAFAANSILNRMAVAGGEMDAAGFAVVRVVAGAVVLAALVAWRGGVVWPGWRGRAAGVAGLVLYLFGFSLAYGGLDAGTGALILFGAVQVTMFAGALVSRDVVPARRWAGAGVAVLGLVVLLWPGGGAGPDPVHTAQMAAAGVGFGIFSLAGRGARDALSATAANFVLAVPVMVLGAVVLPMDIATASPRGLGLAVVSGAVTSGLGYALWYAILPALGASRAGVAQLTVPVIAAAGGALILAEPVGMRLVAGGALVLGGVLWASLAPRARVTPRA
ncbi:MAG: EamA family transporter [Gemmobacter sp.]